MDLTGQTPLTSSTAKQKTDDEFWPLSDGAFFSVILGKSQVRPKCNMYIPLKIQAMIPSLNLPATLTYHGRNWVMNYVGKPRQKRLDGGWRRFCDDNNLKCGDGCVFELVECSSEKLRFGVQILRGDIPVELRNKIRGVDVNNPILVD